MADYSDDDSQDTQEGYSQEEEEALRTLNARKHIRNQLEADIEAFLRAGGSIQQIDPNITADPPQKPEAKYGGRPI